MIDRLRSVVSVEISPSVKAMLARDSREEISTDDPDGGTLARDRLWSPEERVHALLDTNDGRMWQQRIVSETGYSEAQVSRILGEMEDDGLVERHWRGGEKVVVLVGGSTDPVRPERP